MNGEHDKVELTQEETATWWELVRDFNGLWPVAQRT